MTDRTTRSDLQQALANRNVRAFLRVVREGETDQSGLAYRKLVGDPPGIYSIADLHDHPRKVVWLANLNLFSSAAGAYQFLTRTWDEIAGRYGLEDFGPSCQDEAAVALIERRGALGSIESGDLASTLSLCSYEWASLPPGRYGQPTIDYQSAFKIFEKWGGSFLYPGE